MSDGVKDSEALFASRVCVVPNECPELPEHDDDAIETAARYVARRINRSPSTRANKLDVVRRVLQQWINAQEILVGGERGYCIVITETNAACETYKLADCRGCPFGPLVRVYGWKWIQKCRLLVDKVTHGSLVDMDGQYVLFHPSSPGDRDRIVAFLKRVLALAQSEGLRQDTE